MQWGNNVMNQWRIEGTQCHKFWPEKLLNYELFLKIKKCITSSQLRVALKSTHNFVSLQSSTSKLHSLLSCMTKSHSLFCIKYGQAHLGPLDVTSLSGLNFFNSGGTEMDR